MISKKKEKEDLRKVGFAGATISRLEGNRIGLTLIVSIAGAVSINVFWGVQNKVVVFLISLTLAAIGYFVIAKKVFKA